MENASGFLSYRFFQRRKFIVNKSVQLRLLWLSLAYILFFCFVLASALFIPLIIELNNPNAVPGEVEESATQILYLHDKFWLAALLALVVVGLHSILTSHRIAGPLYRFDRMFKSIRDGRLPAQVKLRKRDFLIKEMDTINEMIESLRDRFNNLHQAGTAVREAARACVETESITFGEDFISRIERLEETAREFEDKLTLLLKE